MIIENKEIIIVIFPKINIKICRNIKPELKTLEWDILNHDLLINLEIKKKSRSSIDLDIHHSKVFSSGKLNMIRIYNFFL